MKTNKKVMTTLLLSSLCACTMVSGITLMASAETTPAFEMTVNNVASIRLDTPTGIRFSTTVKGDFTQADGYTFGMLVYPQDSLGGAELTHEVAGATDIVTKAWVDELSTTERDFNSVLSGIPEEAAGYGRMLTARAYYAYNGEYTYSDTTITRSIAQTASYLLNSGETNSVYSTYVNAVAESVSVDVATLNMVVGGKETVVATTSPADYKAVWTSDNEDVATVDKNGVVTAVANGTANIVATFGEQTATCVVTVSDYVQKDGSELVYTTENPTVGGYAVTDETVGGRTGVYKYTSTAKEWTDKLNVKVGGHLNSGDGPAKVAALREFKSKYNYVTFDIYLTKGSSAMVSSLINADDYAQGSGTAPGETLAPGTSITEANGNITVYNVGKAVSAISVDTWYTVVVDYSQIDVDVFAEKAGVYSRIEIGGILGTIYFDNVRYYANDSWETYIAETKYVQCDGSEFLSARPWTTGTYVLENEEVYGRTDVYKYTSTNSWGDKMSIKQTHHMSTSTPTYSSPTIAQNNMKGNNYTYVSFDVCLSVGGIIINAPDASSTNTSLQKYDKVNINSITKGSDLISYYTVDSNGVYTEVEKLAANTWYTVVIAYDSSLTHTTSSYAGIDVCSGSTNTVAYFDNVRYYSANPIGA